MAGSGDKGRDLGLAMAVKFIRALRGWNQRELARASGIDQGQISRFEKGKRTPSPATLKRLAAAARVPYALVELALPSLRESAAGDLSALPQETGVTGDAGAAEAFARAVARVVEAEAFDAAVALGLLGILPAEEGASVEELWRNLEDLSEVEQAGLVDGGRDYRTAPLCVQVCAESERAAAVDALRAVALARLALRIAALIEGTDALRSRIAGYAWAHFANAWRVANDLAAAEKAFANAWRLWDAGAEAADDDLLDTARMLDLEASLRRAQRRFGEALELHDRALAVARSASAAFILLNKSATYEQAGRYERAIATLNEAAPLIEGKNEPRQLFGLRFNVVANLCHLDRYAEAEALVPEVRRMAEALATDLDRIRVRWLEAKVGVGLGRREEAVAALEQVRREFAARTLPYDMALASLDLAVLYLEDKRTAEVKELAEAMLEIFRAQKVHREALMALGIFHRAVQAERAGAELARRLAAYLEQARRNPKLKFNTSSAATACREKPL